LAVNSWEGQVNTTAAHVRTFTPVSNEIIPIQLLLLFEREHAKLDTRPFCPFFRTICVSRVANHHSFIRANILKKTYKCVDVFCRYWPVAVATALYCYRHDMIVTDLGFEPYINLTLYPATPAFDFVISSNLAILV